MTKSYNIICKEAIGYEKIVVMLLSIIMLLGVLPVYASDKNMVNLKENNSKKEINEAAKEEIANWENVKKYIDNNNKTKSGEVTTSWYYPISKSLSVPLHTQQTGYWCGPASTLAIIHYNGKLKNVSGSTEYAKQKEIATESGTTKSGSNTLSLCNTLNDYVSSVHEFNVKKISGASGDYDALFNLIDYNIFNQGQPVMVLVNTKYLPYYNGNTYYHYIVIDSMTKIIHDGTGTVLKSSSKVKVVDPNYKSSYNGIFEVSYDDLYNAVKGYYNAGQQAYNVCY